MINNFLMMGKGILKNSGFETITDEVEKRKQFLGYQTLIPVKRKEGIDRGIVLDFDLRNEEFRFRLDRELLEPKSDRKLTEEYRNYFFAFKVGAPRDAKKFLATNNIESFINRTVSDSIDYLQDRRSDKKSGPWFKENIPETYDDLLIEIRNKFYRLEGEKYVLNPERLAADQKERFLQLHAEARQKQKDPSKPAALEKLYPLLLLNLYRHGDNKKLPPIFSIKINGTLIHEITAYKQAYVNLVYYDLFQRFFVENNAGRKRCHVCGQERDVTGKIPLPMKFYGTTNSLYFENIDNKNSYKSFGICHPCLANVMVGMKFTENYLNFFMFGVTSYIIPSLQDNDPQFEEKLKVAVKIITGGEKSCKHDIENLKSLLKRSDKKGKSFAFNIMFYHAEQQSFDILKYITDIHLKRLMEKMALFDEYSSRYALEELGQFGSSLRLRNLRYYLFPSKQSHNTDKPEIYRKDLLNFLENFLNEYAMKQKDLISSFMEIYRRRFNKNDRDALSPFKMILFLTILHQFTILKEDKYMSQGTSVSGIHNRSYEEFFTVHENVYGHHAIRQGLFLLGTVISRIVAAQMKKPGREKVSSTFLRKIKFDGIPVRRIAGLIGDVKEYAGIYNIWEERGLWGNIMDRLQGVQDSEIKADEVAFYILTGISFEDYLRMKAIQDKKMNQ